MNIIVKTYGGRTTCRPDTTWERENKDIFVPDNAKGYFYTPVLFARISKAGKCIGRKFASRYYDSVGYGMLLYCSDMMDGSAESIAAASCMDHTSILPFPMYNRITLESLENTYCIIKDGNTIFSTQEGNAEMIETSLCESSRIVSVRTGDIIAIELAQPTPLAEYKGNKSDESGTVKVSGTFCGNEIFDFRIIF